MKEPGARIQELGGSATQAHKWTEWTSVNRVDLVAASCCNQLGFVRVHYVYSVHYVHSVHLAFRINRSTR
jgi:hypothetical protein